MWKYVKYCLPLVIYASMFRAMYARGWTIYLPIIISFGLIPMLELFFMKGDARNLSPAEEELAKKDPLYDLMIWLIVPAQFGLLYVFLLETVHSDLLWWERVGRISVMGLACGAFGINVAHELGHRKNKAEQTMAKALLLTSLYTQFFVEHNKGHHKQVSTPQDPSSAPYGMSLYRFWLRSLVGTYMNAWHISNREQQKGGLAWFQNEMVQLQTLSLIFLALIVLVFSSTALWYFLPAALIGGLLLETVNYIEHYGLQRKKTTEDSYERPQPWHSWNSNHALGRMVLFELSRHSDHHYKASRKYQILRHHASAPQLPTGYPGSMLLSLFPPIWFWVMNRQIKKYQLLSDMDRNWIASKSIG